MPDTHTRIMGYRTLSDEEMSLVNQTKLLEKEVASFLNHAFESIRRLEGGPCEGTRQIALARSEFESAFMRLVRGIARPETPWRDAR